MATKTKTKKLTERLRLLLIMAANQSGSFDPKEALIPVEEQMTPNEYSQASDFLQWVTNSERTFGHGNIDTLWAEHQHTL